jgi:FKBP-type peptidyl-prolyl cis-trans isomerase FkpA
MTQANREQRREARARKQRNQRLILLGILLLFVAVILAFNWRKIFPSRGDMITTASGLQYEDIIIGSGQEAKIGDIVSVHYTGWLENGTKFDSSLDRNQPLQFQIGTGMVIQGWDEGVTGMKVGGTRRLTIPSNLAYGEQGAGGVIPPNATLIFEVRLLGIN